MYCDGGSTMYYGRSIGRMISFLREYCGTNIADSVIFHGDGHITYGTDTIINHVDWNEYDVPYFNFVGMFISYIPIQEMRKDGVVALENGLTDWAIDESDKINLRKLSSGPVTLDCCKRDFSDKYFCWKKLKNNGLATIEAAKFIGIVKRDDGEYLGSEFTVRISPQGRGFLNYLKQKSEQ